MEIEESQSVRAQVIGIIATRDFKCDKLEQMADGKSGKVQVMLGGEVSHNATIAK